MQKVGTVIEKLNCSAIYLQYLPKLILKKAPKYFSTDIKVIWIIKNTRNLKYFQYLKYKLRNRLWMLTNNDLTIMRGSGKSSMWIITKLVDKEIDSF